MEITPQMVIVHQHCSDLFLSFGNSVIWTILLDAGLSTPDTEKDGALLEFTIDCDVFRRRPHEQTEVERRYPDN